MILLVIYLIPTNTHLITGGQKYSSEYPHHIIKDKNKINIKLPLIEYTIKLDGIIADKFMFILFLDFLSEVIADGKQTNITKKMTLDTLDIFFDELKPLSMCKKYSKDIIDSYLLENDNKTKHYFISDIILKSLKNNCDYYNFSLEDKTNYEKIGNNIKKFKIKNAFFDINLLNQTTPLGDNIRENDIPFKNMLKYLESIDIKSTITNTYICDGMRIEAIETNHLMNKLDYKCRDYKIYINNISFLEIICSVYSLLDPKLKNPLCVAGVKVLNDDFYPLIGGQKLKAAIESKDNTYLINTFFRKTCKDIMFTIDSLINNSIIISKDSLPINLSILLNHPSILVSINTWKESGHNYYIKRLYIPKKVIPYNIETKIYTNSKYIKDKVFLIRRRINQGERLALKWYKIIGDKNITYKIIDYVVNKYTDLITEDDISELINIISKNGIEKNRAKNIATRLVKDYMINYQII